MKLPVVIGGASSLAAALTFLIAPLLGQQSSGSISGLVQDSQTNEPVAVHLTALSEDHRD